MTNTLRRMLVVGLTGGAVALASLTGGFAASAAPEAGEIARADWQGGGITFEKPETIDNFSAVVAARPAAPVALLPQSMPFSLRGTGTVSVGPINTERLSDGPAPSR